MTATAEMRAGVAIEKVDLIANQGALISLMQRCLDAQANDERFRWLYLDCPFGPARAWVIRDSKSPEKFIGMAAAFPRIVTTPEGSREAWVLGDFCILPEYRTLGPAILLQKACLAGIEKGSFWFDFPAKSMMAVYQRLGIPAKVSQVRWTLPLDARAPIAARAGGVIAWLLKPLANLYMRVVQQRRLRVLAGIKVSVLKDATSWGNFPIESSSQANIEVNRTSAYLRWRYLKHPGRHYQAAVAYVEGTPVAGVVFEVAPEQLVIADLLGNKEPQIVTALLAAVAQIARDRGSTRINFPVLASDPISALLPQLGFCAREEKPVISFSPQSGAWVLYDGDRES